MATVAQIAANRINALKSTGPRTPEGKQRSAGNAVKWGLFSQHVVLTEQDAAQWEELSSRIRTLLGPADLVEELLVDEVIANWFRLARCLKIDSGLFRAFSTYQGQACGLGTAFAQAAQLDCFGKLSRYEQHLERKLAQSLQRLQSTRRFRPQAAPATSSPVPPVTPVLLPQGDAPPTTLAGPPESASTKSLELVPRQWRAIVVKLAGVWSRFQP